MKLAPMLLTTGLILLTGGVQAAQDDAAIEERMTREEFERAGLDKLSPRELEFLNAWLGGDREEATAQAVEEATTKAVEEAVAASKEDQVGLRPKMQDRRVIESHIVGEFDGWYGKTRFKLANGQVWRQIESGTYRVKRTVDPKVRIEPKSMGSWKLYVEGTRRGVKVTRIE